MATALLCRAAATAALRGARARAHHHLFPKESLLPLLITGTLLAVGRVGWARAAEGGTGFGCSALLPPPLTGGAAAAFWIAARGHATSSSSAVSEAAGVHALPSTESVVSPEWLHANLKDPDVKACEGTKRRKLGGTMATARVAVTTARAFSSAAAPTACGGSGGVSMVQGASRGIGLEFVRQLLRRSDQGRVIATCRAPDAAAELQKLKQEHAQRLTVLPLDVTDEATIKAAAASIGETHGSLNLLINATGILSIPNVIHPETTLSKVQKSSLLLAYEVNAVGPILVIKHMWPFLKIGGRSETLRGFSLVANMSARVGSIGDNGLGGWHSYRASKTALNQLTKTVSVELGKKDNIACILLHPGTVDTDLSRPFQKNVPKEKLFTKEFSVQKLLSTIDNVNKSDNGKFFAWDGQEIPW